MKTKLQLTLSYLFSFHLICFHSWLPLLWDFPPGKALQLSLLQAESSSCLLPHLWWNSITVTPRVSPAHPPVLSAQFSHSVTSDSLQTHGLQHARLPCPSPTPGACSNSCLSSRWCHTTILPSVVPFSSCLQSFPASGYFPRSQFFASGGQSIGVSASASVLPINIQNWFPLGLTGFISLQSKGLSRVFSNTTVQKHQFFGAQLSLSPTLTSIHDYWKNHSFD